MSKVYMKMMVSFDANEKKLIENPTEVVKSALRRGVKIDGEVYFPMTEYNDSLYELYSKDKEGIELNIDNELDECTVMLID